MDIDNKSELTFSLNFVMHNVFLSDKGMLGRTRRMHKMCCFCNLEMVSFYFEVNVVARMIRKVFY